MEDSLGSTIEPAASEVALIYIISIRMISFERNITNYFFKKRCKRRVCIGR